MSFLLREAPGCDACHNRVSQWLDRGRGTVTLLPPKLGSLPPSRAGPGGSLCRFRLFPGPPDAACGIFLSGFVRYSCKLDERVHDAIDRLSGVAFYRCNVKMTVTDSYSKVGNIL